MASILDMVSQMATPEMIGTVSKMAGLDPEQVSGGLSVAGPLLTSALASKAATPEGAAGLLGTLTKGENAGMLDNVMGALGSQGGGDIGSLLGGLMSGGGAAAGGAGGLLGALSGASGGGGMVGGLLNSMLGPGLKTVAATVKDKTGYDITPLLPMAVPLVLGVISKMTKQQNLDASGLAGLLKGEASQFQTSNPTLASTVSEALAAGEKVNAAAEATKAAFSPAEWIDLGKGLVMPSLAVAGSSLSGAGGIAKELAALGSSLSGAIDTAAPGSLVSQIGGEAVSMINQVVGGQKSLEDYGIDLKSVSGTAISQLKHVVSLLDSKASPEDASFYKATTLDAARSTATAAREGGFLGFGGKDVSAEEQATLDKITSTLGTTA